MANSHDLNEPVAWRWPTHNGYAYAETHFDDEGGEPLYAAPVRTKDLTPDELFSIANKVGFDGELMKTNHDRGMPSIAEQYARAVIAADRELNK